MRAKTGRQVPIGILWATTLVLNAWAGAAGALELQVEGDRVEVTGVTAGGEVALLSVWRQVESHGGTQVTLLDEVLRDDDGDGRVTFEPASSGLELGPIPELSVWVAADVATGDSATATPGRFEPPLAVARRAGGSVEIELTRPVTLWVRPGLAAFRAHVRDGEVRDRDRAADGRVTLEPPSFGRLAGRPEQTGPPDRRPPAFAAGDVVVGIDAGTLALATLRIPSAVDPQP